MIKKVYILLIFLLSILSIGVSQTTDLLISEYIEGSSNNKYIEIYNGTGTNVNLANYQLRLYSNGATTPSTTNTLTGILANNSVIVYRNSGATIYAGATTISSAVNFNGDDALELFNTTTGLMVDLIGNIGCDPGTQWSSGGNNTKDKTLVRNANVCNGVTSDPAALCPFPTLATEWTQFSKDDISNLGIHTNTCSTPCLISTEPTISSSSLAFPDTTCSSIDLSWTTGNGANTIVVASTSPITGTPTDQIAYTANAIFGSGATIAAGEFVVFNGNGTTTTVTGLTASTTYYFAIFEYNGAAANCEENYLTSSFLTGNFTTPICPPSNCPEITGILIDACGGTIEGINEFFTFQNSNTALEIDSLTANFPSGGSFCNSGCGGQTWTTNPTYVAQLNTDAACPGLFVEADPIPANADVIVFTGQSPTYAFDFTGLCGTGPYYAVFANNTSTSGRFANYNSTCSNRTLTVDFGTTCSDTASYNRCLLTGGATHDGDFVTYDAAGNPTYLNDGCTPTSILPITLLNFSGKKLTDNSNLLTWTTSSEINNDYFTLEKSADAINFTEIGTVLGAGNSNTPLSYYFIDDAPFNGVNYYRLKQTDFDGAFEYFNIIALNNETNNANIFVVNNNLQINLDTEVSNGTIEIYDAIGRVVYSENITSNKRINTDNFNTGIYIIKVSTPTNIIVEKIKF